MMFSNQNSNIISGLVVIKQKNYKMTKFNRRLTKWESFHQPEISLSIDSRHFRIETIKHYFISFKPK